MAYVQRWPFVARIRSGWLRGWDLTNEYPVQNVYRLRTYDWSAGRIGRCGWWRQHAKHISHLRAATVVRMKAHSMLARVGIANALSRDLAHGLVHDHLVLLLFVIRDILSRHIAQMQVRFNSKPRYQPYQTYNSYYDCFDRRLNNTYDSRCILLCR